MKVYIDTSVYGGYYDEEFAKETKSLFRKISSGWYSLVFSDTVDLEIENAPTNVKRLYARYRAKGVKVVVNPQVVKLARAYISEGFLPNGSINDAIHIALCTIYDVPFLVSWDKKHIANKERIVKINVYNVENGYNILNIVTPKSII